MQSGVRNVSQPAPWGKLQGVRPSKLMQRFLDSGLSLAEAALRMQQDYGIAPDKADLLSQASTFTRALLAGLDPKAVSIYVGIPFCPTRCLYCSFPSHSLAELGKERGRFVHALAKETAALGSYLRQNQRPMDSVYVGGGTPTALAPADLDSVLTALERELPGDWREFTVEAGRPETLTDEQLAVLVGHHVQRISINPQTSNDRTLQVIGRKHRVVEVEAAYRKSRALFPVINMDLILGLPGEGLGDVQNSLRWVLDLRPENITLHMFSPKRASRFTSEQSDWAGQLPGWAESQSMTEWCYAQLTVAGYRPYYLYRQRNILGGQENVGWALPGTECRYNVIMIEERQDLLGLGGGATSKFLQADGSLENLSNQKDVLTYIDRVDQLIEHKLGLLSAPNQLWRASR